ncbi:hypothetical protein IFM12276_55990 [Nocardia sputorum]|uniref:Uncharacterized protein n=1 Tax=Nocardia sputorum TaxID=2984338 RepID=A0ABM8D560_9NOCA|nr:hypothetical protein IFM12276_55990 [Nocardia sputorum]
MHHHRENVLLRRVHDPQQPDANRHVGGHIEGGRRERVHLALDLVRTDRMFGHIQRHLARGQHHLHRTIGRLRIHRAQHLVPRHHIAQRRTQRAHIQRTGQPQRERQVVGRRTGRRDGVLDVVEAVEEPHPPLRQRQRQLLRTSDTPQPHTALTVGMRLQRRRQRRDRGCLEQRTHRHLSIDRRPETRHDPRGDQRIAAEREEIVIRADPVHAEHRREHLGDDFLDRRRRRTESPRREGRLGKRLAIELAAGIQRERVQRHDGSRNHVGGQRFRDRREQVALLDRVPGRGYRVGDQLVAQGRRRDHRHGLAHRRLRQQRRLDLTQLDPLTAELHLEIGPAQIVQPVR